MLILVHVIYTCVVNNQKWSRNEVNLPYKQ